MGASGWRRVVSGFLFGRKSVRSTTRLRPGLKVGMGDKEFGGTDVVGVYRV